MADRLIVVCNALVDSTRTARRISTDSPAASRKVFLMARALRHAGVRVHILSFARGRQDGSGRYYRRCTGWVRRVAVVNLPFLNLPILSELISFLAPVPVLYQYKRFKGRTAVIFYNCMPLHLPALLTSTMLRYRTVLDLEDGNVGDRRYTIRRFGQTIATWVFEFLCSGGALLANTALARQIRLRPTMCYYGAIEHVREKADLFNPVLRVLLGGTVSRDTGARQLTAAIRLLRQDKPLWCRNIRFEIAGHGDCIGDFAELASAGLIPEVYVHGRLSDKEYDELVARSHIALALKPYMGQLAQTTFPSKVVELANAGHLVVSTDISDVRMIFGSCALYLSSESPLHLIEHLRWIESHRPEAAAMAKGGVAIVRALCAIESVGPQLSAFLFEGAK